MADEIIQLSAHRKWIAKSDCREIPDCEENHARNGTGPPVGSYAFFCPDPCRSAAFYLAPEGIRCYFCHELKLF